MGLLQVIFVKNPNLVEFRGSQKIQLCHPPLMIFFFYRLWRFFSIFGAPYFHIESNSGELPLYKYDPINIRSTSTSSLPSHTFVWCIGTDPNSGRRPISCGRKYLQAFCWLSGTWQDTTRSFIYSWSEDCTVASVPNSDDSKQEEDGGLIVSDNSNHIHWTYDASCYKIDNYNYLQQQHDEEQHLPEVRHHYWYLHEVLRHHRYLQEVRRHCW